MALIKRSDKLAFYGVKGENDSYTYHRMTGFTELSVSKNPKEYTRQYIDEIMERTDVVGYSPSISYSFDLNSGNAVHEDIVSISDNEYTGDSAVRPIVMVDTSKLADNAVLRSFSVIPDSEGDNTEVYTYGGSFRVSGEKEFVTASTTDGWQTCTIG